MPQESQLLRIREEGGRGGGNGAGCGRGLSNRQGGRGVISTPMTAARHLHHGCLGAHLNEMEPASSSTVAEAPRAQQKRGHRSRCRWTSVREVKVIEDSAEMP